MANEDARLRGHDQKTTAGARPASFGISYLRVGRGLAFISASAAAAGGPQSWSARVTRQGASGLPCYPAYSDQSLVPAGSPQWLPRSGLASRKSGRVCPVSGHRWVAAAASVLRQVILARL